MMWCVVSFNPHTGQDQDLVVTADEMIVNGGVLLFLVDGKLSRIIRDFRECTPIVDLPASPGGVL